MLASRSHALAAISHDLRTIITRMRLRSEFIEDVGLKEKMLKDILSMDAMLRRNLEYLRDGDTQTERLPIDIDSLSKLSPMNFVKRDKMLFSGARRARWSPARFRNCSGFFQT